MMSSKGASFECCMCGDTGLSYELFRCKVCQFRSQHRYCSNLYPKAESYRVCNWCLITKEENAGNTSNSSNSSSPYNKDPKSAKKKSTDQQKMISATTPTSKSSQPMSPIKKPRSSPESSRKRLGGGGGEEAEAERLIRRTRSEEMANESATRVPRHVFRNKVRRYKLLEEVSS